MKEIGGYIELDTYRLPMLHEGAIALNCGRNCIAYLFKSRKIKKIKVPYFICNSILGVCSREGVEQAFYHIGLDFKPEPNLKLSDDEWLYLMNFYGQLSNDEIQGYDGIWFDEEFKKNNLLDVYCTYSDGDKVTAYKNTSHSLGTILFKADSVDEMKEITDNIEKYYRVLVK